MEKYIKVKGCDVKVETVPDSGRNFIKISYGGSIILIKKGLHYWNYSYNGEFKGHSTLDKCINLAARELVKNKKGIDETNKEIRKFFWG